MFLALLNFFDRCCMCVCMYMQESVKTSLSDLVVCLKGVILKLFCSHVVEGGSAYKHTHSFSSKVGG